MCLMKPDDGILGSAITWSQFEQLLKESLKTEATFGPNKAVLNIGDGKGFASITAMITCDWTGAENAEKLLARVVLKIPSMLAFRVLNDSMPEEHRLIKGGDAEWKALEANMKVTHNIESASYDFFEDFDGLQMPRKYFTQKHSEEANGFLCFEYMENSRMMEFFEVYDVKLMSQIARALGKLGACAIRKEITDPDLQLDLMSEFATKMFDKQSFCNMHRGLVAWDSSEKMAQLLDKVVVMAGEYYGANLPATLHKQLGLKPVLVAGDCHTGNVLINRDSGDLMAIIDWQTTHLGFGIEDLTRIMLFSMTAKDRRENTAHLLEEYYNAFLENLDGEKVPYTLETLTTVYNLLFPSCALFFTAFVPMMMKKHQDDTTLTTEQKDSYIAVEMEKVLGAYDEMLEMHEKNKEEMKNLKMIYTEAK